MHTRQGQAGQCGGGGEPPALTSLAVLLTFRCNYDCAHCAFRAGARRKDTVDEAFARGVLRAAREAAPGLSFVAFSGGEPFLLPGLLSRLVEHAGTLGLASGVTSNAFWARTEERALAVLRPLQARGLADFTTSLDDFHLAHGPPERVRHAVLAARRLGLRVHINIAVQRGSPVRAARVHEVLGVEAADLEGVEVCEFGPTRVGFAGERLDEGRIHRDRLEVIGAPCAHALRSVTLTPDGSLYGCCGVGGATDTGPSALLRLGSLHEETFATLHGRMQHSLLLHLIARVGPQVLIELARSANPDLPVRERYSHICDVCHELATNRRLRAQVAGVLRTLASQEGPR